MKDRIYVNGSQKISCNTGDTAAHAYQSIEKAFEERIEAVGEGEFTVIICGPTTISRALCIPEGVQVLLTSRIGKKDFRHNKSAGLFRQNGRELYSGSMFRICGTMTLENITIDGGASGNSQRTGQEAEDALITVETTGTLNIKDGTSLKNNINISSNTQGSGGAVRSRGKLLMTGGEIIQCGAVYGCAILVNGGVCTLTGGRITGNCTDVSDVAIYCKDDYMPDVNLGGDIRLGCNQQLFLEADVTVHVIETLTAGCPITVWGELKQDRTTGWLPGHVFADYAKGVAVNPEDFRSRIRRYGITMGCRNKQQLLLSERENSGVIDIIKRNRIIFLSERVSGTVCIDRPDTLLICGRNVGIIS